ncbi:MAG: sensor histidine kinase [Chryseobacterium sp.]|nr:MAG: sensor histidine kinase [Chryseobacterium sp.]
MWKQKNIFTGIFISLFVAAIVFIPRPISKTIFSPSWEGGFISFIHAFLCWLFSQWSFYSRKNTSLFLKSLLCGAFSIVISFIGFYIIYFFPEIFKNLHQFSLKKVLLFFIIRGIIVAAFTFFIIYLIFVSEESSRLKREAENIKKDHLEARLYALQQQISPHFLFNALSTLRNIAQDKTTKNYVVQFSNVFRYLLDANNSPLVFLKDEMVFTKSYLHILQERFENALNIHLDIPEKYNLYQLPPIAIQILIENAIKHNIVSLEEPLTISIFIDENNEMLVIENTLQLKISVEESTGTGLKNIQERYLLLSQKKIHIEQIKNKFIVSIPLLKSSYENINN